MRFDSLEQFHSRRRKNRIIMLLCVVGLVAIYFFIPGIRTDDKKTEIPGINEFNQPSTINKIEPTDLPTLVARIKKSIVLIKTYDAAKAPIAGGTGFFIKEDGQMISNRHVFQGASGADAQTGWGLFPITKVLAESSEYDMVKVVVYTGKIPVRPLEINRDLPKVGESIIVIGNPLGLEASVSTGIVSAIRSLDPYGTVIQITCPISHGSSGSPVLNMKGQVVGIATFLIEGGQNLNFAIPMSRIANLKEVKDGTMASINYGGEQFIDKIENPYDKGKVLFDNRQYQGAIGYFLEAIKKNSNDAEVHYYLGYCYKEIKNTGAIGEFKAALDIDPNHYKAYCQMGIAYLSLNQPAEALDALKRAVRLKPDYDEAYLHLGIAYYLNKEYSEAERALKKSLDIYPEAQGFLFLGMLYCETTQYDKAIQPLLQYKETAPNDLRPYVLLAYAYASEQDWTRGIEILNKAMIIDPQSAEVHYLLGIIHLGNNNLITAQIELDTLYKLRNNHGFASKLASAISTYKYNHR